MKWLAQILLFLIGLVILVGCEEEEDLYGSGPLPNIVWLVAEDQSPNFFPMYGDSTVALPNLERLATEGVIFTNAFSPVPVCAPARSAIITGMYPTTLGTHNMRTYNAYREENEPELGIPSYSPRVPQGVKMFTEYLRAKGYYCTNNAKEDYNFKPLESAWDESSANAHWRNRPSKASFFSVFNFGITHESQIWKKTEDSLLVSPEKISVPPYFPDTEQVRHDLAVNYSNLKRLDFQIGEIIQQLLEDGLYDDTIIFFYADHGGPFPRHKRALYDTGVRVPMIIKFQDGKKESNYDDRLLSFIDLAPTVLSLAHIEPPKVMQGRALLGRYQDPEASQYTFFSADRFDELVDRLRAVRSKRFKYIKNFNPELPHALPVSYREQMPLMQELNKYYTEDQLDSVQLLWMKTPKPEEELYDLQNDPLELVNLATDEKYRDTLVHLRNRLTDWIQQSNDLGQFAEKELINKWFADGKTPKLPPLELEEKERQVRLITRHEDATIIWKKDLDTIWKVYAKPLKTTDAFVAKAVRIGYEASELLEYNLD